MLGVRSSVQNNSNIPAAMNFTVSPRLASGQPRSHSLTTSLESCLMFIFVPHGHISLSPWLSRQSKCGHPSPPRVRETMHMTRNKKSDVLLNESSRIINTIIFLVFGSLVVKGSRRLVSKTIYKTVYDLCIRPPKFKLAFGGFMSGYVVWKFS